MKGGGAGKEDNGDTTDQQGKTKEKSREDVLRPSPSPEAAPELTLFTHHPYMRVSLCPQQAKQEQQPKHNNATAETTSSSGYVSPLPYSQPSRSGQSSA